MKETNKRQMVELIVACGVIVLTIIAVICGIIAIFKSLSANDELESVSGILESNSTNATAQQESTAEVTTEAVTSATESTTQATTQIATQAPINGNGKKVYLTFDDGPSQNTDIILDTLKKYGVKATFFVAMPRADGAATIARYKRIINEGHTLAVHSYTHDYNSIYVSIDTFANDVTKMRDYIYNNTGYMPTIYRFPGGSSNSYIGRVGSLTLEQAKTWLVNNNFSYFDWNVSSGDANTATVEVSYILKNIFESGSVSVVNKPVSVVLMHDSETKTTTAEAVDIIVKRLLDGGYEILPITKDTVPVRHFQ